MRMIETEILSEEFNRIRYEADKTIREIKRKITAEQAINLSKWDKKSTWTKYY
jgi:hypothetical protein